MSLLDKVKAAFGGGQQQATSQAGESPAGISNDVVLKWFEKRWPRLKVAYWTYHQNIWRSFLCYAGETYVDPVQPGRGWLTPKATDDEFIPYPRINRFAPAIDAVASNYAMPEVEAVAEGEDLENEPIADIANALKEHAMKTLGLRSDFGSHEDKAALAKQIYTLAGCVFTDVRGRKVQIASRPVMTDAQLFAAKCPTCDTYNETEEQPPAMCPTCGQPYQIGQVSRQVQAYDDTGEPVSEPISRCEVICTIGNPLHALPRIGATDMHGYMIWAERMSLDAIKEKFDFEAKVDSEQIDSALSTYENALSYFYYGVNQGSGKTDDSALVAEIFIEPGAVMELERGCYAVIINGKVVKAEEWQFTDHPKTKADHTAIPTMFFGRSPAFDMVELQVQLNQYEQIAMLHAKTGAMPTWLQDVGTIVSEITGRGDIVVKYKKQFPDSEKPERIPGASLDIGIYKKIEMLHEEFENVSGAVSVFKGQQPGGVTAASAISQLRSQAELRYAPSVKNWNNFWCETIRKIVRVYQAQMEPWEIAEIVGQGRDADIELFRAADLNTDIDWVATESGLPRTRAERRDEMMVMFDKGALDINDPNVKEKIFQLFGDTGLMKQFNADATRARRENKLMEQGDLPLFLPQVEDLAVHLAIHGEDIKDLNFDRLDPQVQKLKLMHFDQTKAALSAQNMPALPPSKPGLPTPSNAQPPAVEAAAAGGIQ